MIAQNGLNVEMFLFSQNFTRLTNLKGLKFNRILAELNTGIHDCMQHFLAIPALYIPSVIIVQPRSICSRYEFKSI